jgi:Rubrerythrin
MEFKCSKCGNTKASTDNPKYCPMCGAKNEKHVGDTTCPLKIVKKNSDFKCKRCGNEDTCVGIPGFVPSYCPICGLKNESNQSSVLTNSRPQNAQ